MKRARRIALGVAGACALICSHAALASAVTGSVMAAGENDTGQLGNGTTDFSSLLTPVSALSDVTSVDGHRAGGLALLGDGTVMAWGRNDVGQLGNGTHEDSLAPTPVSGLSEVTAISAYGKSCLALLANGTVMAWGENNHGQLGDGTSEKRATPVPVSGLTGVVAIAAGEAHGLALLSNGEVVGWGSNVHGQVGNGSSEDSHTPVPVTGLSGIVAIAAGGEHSLALTSGGAVMAWGNGAHGQLGNATTIDSSTPVQAKSVTGLSEATAISAGEFSSLALLASERVMAWGGDEWGQLGIGEPGSGSKSTTPVAMCGLVKAGGISAGNLANFVYGVTDTLPCPEIESLTPEAGPKAGGTTVTITGSDFSEATAVRFGTADAPSFSIDSPTQITAVTPPGAGEVEPQVITPAGASPRWIEFTYVPRPTVEKISPHKGPASGGTTVKISANGYGAPFGKIKAVKFGPLEAAFKFDSHGNLSAVSPPGLEAGTLYVTVTTNGGTSETGTKADAFKVVPVVSGVTPSGGSRAGGESVTVTGAGFALGGSTQFKFGATKARSVNCASRTECTVLVPPRAPGVVDVKATVNRSPSAKNAPADQFTYE